MKTTHIKILMIFVIMLAFFSLGQEGCNQNNTATKTGVDFSLISRIDTLTEGKTLQPGETFYIGIKLENYDEKERQVELCIRDSLPDQYGGILSQGDCEQVDLPAAEKVKKQSSGLMGSSTTEEINPGTKEVFFPQQNQYSYNGLPEMNQPFQANLMVTIKYPETTTATTTVYVPVQEQPSLSQEPSQIYVSLSKSVYAQGNGYNVNLDLNFVKNPSSRIFLQDFSETSENKTFLNVKLAGQPLDCRTTNNQPVTDILEIQNSKLIKCSTILYQSSQRQDYDLTVTLIYGVMLEKNFGFGINTKQ
jgi:hypothetical protein